MTDQVPGIGDVAGVRKPPVRRPPPTLRHERRLWKQNGGLLAAFDEVGRGALAGPVSVGVVLLAVDTKPAPAGVADSKLLTPEARVRLVPKIRNWALESAVGHSSAAEIDQFGVMTALRLAAERAVGQLIRRPDWVLLDGNHDYLTPKQAPALFELDSPNMPRWDDTGWSCSVPVTTIIKGDMVCASVAAASILAKTERDALLTDLALDHPHYGFELNKAYSTPFHLEALSRFGPSTVHRRSWNLPGVGSSELTVPVGPPDTAQIGAAVTEAAMAELPVMGDDEAMTGAGVSA